MSPFEGLREEEERLNNRENEGKQGLDERTKRDAILISLFLLAFHLFPSRHESTLCFLIPSPAAYQQWSK